MKFNIFSYLLGEGFKNVFKNKKSTISSLAIMCSAMLIFGIFFTIGQNVAHIMDSVQDAQSIQVWVVKDATADQVSAFGDELKAMEEVNSVKFVSKEETANKYKEKLKDYPNAADTIQAEYFSDSYVITLTDLSLNSKVQAKIKDLDNLKKITSSNDAIAKLIKIAKAVRIGTAVLLAACIFIAIFIISNTIRLTVEARKKEIFIMRYVGATNSFIRWPFIVEGIIIGIIAGMISIMLTGIGYKFVQGKIVETEVFKSLAITMTSFGDMFNMLIIVYLALGIGVGIVGSAISMRKYLKA